jgi:hypothetical protein
MEQPLPAAESASEQWPKPAPVCTVCKEECRTGYSILGGTLRCPDCHDTLEGITLGIAADD